MTKRQRHAPAPAAPPVTSSAPAVTTRPAKIRNLFVTATRPNAGKTAITLGITHALVKSGRNIGFIKPVGSADLESGKHKIDEDTLLISRACNVHCNIDDMNPVSIRSGFPTEFIAKGGHEALLKKLTASFGRVSEGKEFVVIEGTGHGAVGAAFGLSNAFTAKMFNAKAILVASGGIGHPIDEILLNQRFFLQEGVEILGVIINKVFPHEVEAIEGIARRILEDHGLRLLGAIPYAEELYQPSMMQVLEELRGNLINGDQSLTHSLGRILLGAMTPHNALERMSGSQCIVTPGDREDLILCALARHVLDPKKEFVLTGLVLTGGLFPGKATLDMIRRTDIPVIVAKEDSYTVASRLTQIVVKISPWDKAKVETICSLVAEHVKIPQILEGLSR